MTVSLNVVVLAGTVAAAPVERRMPSGDELAHPSEAEYCALRLRGRGR